MGRGQAHPGDAALPTPGRGRSKAGSDRTRNPRGGSGPASPGYACAVCGHATARPPLSDWVRAPSGRGQRRSASRVRRSWGCGLGGLWGRRVAPERRPWGSGEGSGGGYLRGGGGAGRVAGGDNGIRPAARPRSPVGLGRGPPLEVSRVAHGSFPPSAQASGCAAPSSPTFSSPAAAGPADSRR